MLADTWTKMDRRSDLKINLALDPNTDPLALASMAANPKASNLLLAAIAKNPSTDTATLVKLAKCPSVAVRRWVALHPNLPYEAFAILVADPDKGLQHKLRLGSGRWFFVKPPPASVHGTEGATKPAPTKGSKMSDNIHTENGAPKVTFHPKGPTSPFVSFSQSHSTEFGHVQQSMYFTDLNALRAFAANITAAIVQWELDNAAQPVAPDAGTAK